MTRDRIKPGMLKNQINDIQEMFIINIIIEFLTHYEASQRSNEMCTFKPS